MDPLSGVLRMKEKMLEILGRCYERLQGLDIQPTQNNMEALLQTLYDLKEVYNRLKEEQDGDGTAADPEGRDGH